MVMVNARKTFEFNEQQSTLCIAHAHRKASRNEIHADGHVLCVFIAGI
jgi:hypothetical protein